MIHAADCDLKVFAAALPDVMSAGEERKMRWKIFPLILIVSGLSGCASIGPGTLARDRLDYITAISNSWKSQMLLNPVQLRYGDAPVFLDVASVINQYGIEGALSSNWYWIDDKDLTSNRLVSFIVFLFTLTETGDEQGAPIITVPAG